MIQGSSVRLVIAAGFTVARRRGAGCAPTPWLSPTPPRFEDAFVDLLGGGPKDESPLADTMPRCTLAEGAAVVEATA